MRDRPTDPMDAGLDGRAAGPFAVLLLHARQLTRTGEDAVAIVVRVFEEQDPGLVTPRSLLEAFARVEELAAEEYHRG